MKFLLTLIMCSGVSGVGCMPPYEADQKFNNLYDCLELGYTMSMNKIKEIGPEDINENLIHIKFYCSPIQET